LTVTWWSSALNRVRLSLRATLRTSSKPLNSLIRLRGFLDTATLARALETR